MSHLGLTFFGTFQATLAKQPITRFRSANNQGLLVYLALQNDRPQPREVLATLFWPEDSEQNARNNLRQALYQLRSLLGDNEKPELPYLLVTRQTVQFNAESDYTLDVGRFLDAIEDRDLESAISYYQGELLPGFTCDSLEFEDWLRQEREQLHHLALEAMAEVTQDQLGAGRLDKAQAVARQQLSLEPWREVAHRQLMQAYALSGDRGHALAQFETARQQLQLELGIEPAPETVSLFQDIQAGRYAPLATEETVAPPVKSRHNLPAETTPFIGRELELAQISQLLTLEQQRLVTIVGPGGMGKTRLALAAASSLLEEFHEGVYFVDLAPLSLPEEIGSAIASALDYQAPDKSQDLWPQLLNSLNQRRLMLILDNFEHLLGGTMLVNELLQSCPQLDILVTSRQRLNLASENRFELGGMDFPESLRLEEALRYTAVRLFVESGRRTRADFTLTENNTDAVLRICQLVQGMPLGLVLAAAWLELLTPEEIGAEIGGSLDFLTADLVDLPARQRSLLAVFERSWEMMTPAEQRVLAKLSVFRGGFTREAAEEVAGANLRLLLSLVNKSLLQRQSQSGRFAMHELLRQYAAQKRLQVDPADAAALAHCHYFANVVKEEIRRAMFFYPILLPRRWTADRDNFLRAWDYALEQGLARELSDLARGIVFLSISQGMKATSIPKKAIETLRQRGLPDTDQAMLHLRLIEISTLFGLEDRYRISELFRQFIPIVERHGELELRYWTYNRAAANYSDSGDSDLLALFNMFKKAYQVALEMEEEVLVKEAEVIRIWMSFFLDELPEAPYSEQLKELLAYFESAFPDSFVVFVILQSLGRHCSRREEYDQAVRYLKRAVNIAKSWQDLFWISVGVDSLTDTYLLQKMRREAAFQQLDALEWHLAIGQTWQTLGFLQGKINTYAQVIGGNSVAIALASMAYHHSEVVPHHKQNIEEVSQRIKQEMGTEAFTAAWDKGKEMDFESAVALVRNALTETEQSLAESEI